MPRCQHCRHEFPTHQPSPPMCPECGRDVLPEQAAADWVPIARLTNLAEVGYFANLIEEQGMSTNIRQHNEFSALDGMWRTTFIVQVPFDHSESAAELMRRELERDERESDDWDAGRPAFPNESEYQIPSMWKPLALVLVAGGVLYYVGRSGVDRPPRPAPARQSLWEVLGESDAPLVSDAPEGQPRRRLRFENSSDTLWLEDDLDGDGRYDRQRRFQQGQFVGEAVRP